MNGDEVVPFEALADTDLIVDQFYDGGSSKTMADDPHFGVFVTTSHFNQQVYTEVRADQHPIALITGSDIVQALRCAGHADLSSVRTWLRQFTTESAPIAGL